MTELTIYDNRRFTNRRGQTVRVFKSASHKHEFIGVINGIECVWDRHGATKRIGEIPVKEEHLRSNDLVGVASTIDLDNPVADLAAMGRAAGWASCPAY